MRFDDTLETVLSADLGSTQAAQSAWRQLVDLIGRRRVPADTRAMGTLRAIRERVPITVRAASARALEFADPPAPLVRLFAIDELNVALPVLRSARMNSAEWVQLLPELAPAGRALLRNRRDLGPIVKRALDAYGPIDFVLPDETVKEVAETPAEPFVEIAVEEMDAFPEPGAFAEPELEPAIEVEEARAGISVESDMLPEPEPIVEAEEAEPTGDEPDVQLAHSAPKASPITHWTATPELAIPAALTAPIMEAQPEPAQALEAEDFSFVALAGPSAVLPILESTPTDGSEIVTVPVQSGTVEPAAPVEAIAPAAPESQGPIMEQGDLSVVERSGDALDVLAANDSSARAGEGGTFEIAEVVARIDAFWRDREDREPVPLPVADNFRFETDSKGVFRWIDGVSRAALVGLSLDVQSSSGVPEASRVDGVAAGAFRRRAGFSTARLAIEGESDAAGDWLISGIPVFDPANGRFTGYRGTGRRPRADERAEPVREAPAPIPADSLRQLVHELRTPTNAIAGFAEMIESQILGPVSGTYRDRAGEIRAQARELLGAIDDLDLAARIDSAALALVPGRVALRPVLSGIADDLAPLVELRGSLLALPVDDLAVTGDRRAVERLLARLLATLVSASGPGERIGVNIQSSEGMVAIAIDRPRALADYPGDSVLGIDDEHEDATLLGTGFALRLARNLARELGGALEIEAKSLTLRLPASENANVGQAHLN